MSSPRIFSALLFLLDALTLALVFAAAAWLRQVPLTPEYLQGVLPVPLALILGCLYLIDGYNRETDMLGQDYASQHLIACLGALIATLLATYVVSTESSPLQISRLVIAGAFASFAPLSLILRRLIRLRIIRGFRYRALVFIGTPHDWDSFRADCKRHGMRQPLFFARIEQAAGKDDSGAHISGILDEVERGGVRAEAIVVQDSGDALPDAIAERLVRCFFRGIPTFTLDLFQQVYWRKIPLTRLRHAWLFEEGFDLSRDPVFERLKRLMDILLSLFGLLLASPLLLTAALLIWLEDRGPVLFAQTRIGRNERPFRLYKLRTMRQQAPGTQADPYTRERDPRITRIGQFLRNTRIDEFPQLLNVLRGQMSLIGPRAEWDRLVAGYQREIPCYHFRHLVRPGITGWAQVNYPYGANTEDTRRKLEYDLYYIRHYSLRLDASIILKTIHIMLFGKGR